MGERNRFGLKQGKFLAGHLETFSLKKDSTYVPRVRGNVNELTSKS